MTLQMQLFTDTDLHKRNRAQVKGFLLWRKHRQEEPEEPEAEEEEEDDFIDSDIINQLAEKFDI